MTALVATVSGLDGSGKTVFARRLAEACAPARVRLLSVDDVRRPVDWRQPGRSEAEIYYEDYFALGDLDARVAAAAREADLVLVEGVFVLRAASLAGAFAVYLDVDLARARARVLERDVARGRTPEDVTHRMDARYYPAQERYLRAHDPRGRADVLIDNDDPARPRLLRGDPPRWPAPLAAPLARLLAP
jgi:uridine kinase